MATVDRIEHSDLSEIDYWMLKRAEWEPFNRKHMTPDQIAWAEQRLNKPLWRHDAALPIAYRASGWYERGATFFLVDGQSKYLAYPKRFQVHESMVAAFDRMAAENRARGISVLGGPLR